ncbi:hypothetical protein B566_EDAN009485, partial [Ephemera danica]
MMPFPVNMTEGPVSKKICLSASGSQNEPSTRARELQRTLKEKYDAEKSWYDIKNMYFTNMNNQLKESRQNLMTKRGAELSCFCKGKCNCNRKHFEKELKCKKVLNETKLMRTKLFNIKQIMDHVLVDKLHALDCTESDDCLSRMQRVLVKDPLSLERKREIVGRSESITSIVGNRRSPLHDAINRGHVKCVGFLLENGAKLTSLTTLENNGILHTLYKSVKDPQKRLDILKLILPYGVVHKLPQNSGKFALNRATSLSAVEEVTILLQLGAIMNKSQVQCIMLASWGVPIELCHQLLLEALQFYKAFGGKFHVCARKDPKRDLMQYLKCYKHRRHFRDVKPKIKALVSNPMSLTEISRLAVRKCIRKDYFESIKKLEVPEDLQPVLRFDDVTITKLPD